MRAMSMPSLSMSADAHVGRGRSRRWQRYEDPHPDRIVVKDTTMK
jgi:hypothetical protein